MILLDALTLGLTCFFSIFIGVLLSGIFGSEAPDLLRVLLGLIGLFAPPGIVLLLRNHTYWSRIRLGIITLLIGMIVIRCASLKPEDISKTSSNQEMSQKSGRVKQDHNINYKNRSVKLVPYSKAILQPNSKSNGKLEEANRQRFIQAFQTEEVLITYECGFNTRGLYSDSSLISVSPQNLYSLINTEFKNSTGSSFNSDLCVSNNTSSSLRSLDILVSVIN